MNKPESTARSDDSRQLRMIAPFQSEHVFVELDGLGWPPAFDRTVFFSEDDLVDSDHRPMSWVDYGLGRSLLGIRFNWLFDFVWTHQSEHCAMLLKQTASWPA